MDRRSEYYHAVRCWNPPSFGPWFVLLSIFLASSVAAANGYGQDDSGGVTYRSRAPRSCPHRPDHCSLSDQTPWTCRPESDCFRRVSIIPPDSKSHVSVNLTASTYYFNASGKRCYHALNLTWTMNPKGIIGFFLRITRYDPSRGIFNTTRLLAFWIDERRLMPERERENGMVPFYFDCWRLGAASTYHFDLFSIRAVPDSNNGIVSEFLGVGSLTADCDTYPEADPVFRMWDAYTHISFSASASSVKLFFRPAPPSIGFRSYDLTVSTSAPFVILAGVYDLTFTCPNFDGVVIRNICPGTYTVLVTAKGGYCPCADCSSCVTSSELVVPGSKGDCRNDNITVVVPSLVTVSSPAAALLPEDNKATSRAAKGSSDNIVNGILIMTFGVVVSVVVVAVAVHSKRRKKLNSASTSAAVVDELGLENQTVLVIDAEDNAYHCNAVRCLASYLERRCRCRVVQLDRGRSDETGGDPSSAVDRVLAQMESVDSVVVVNSEAGWRLYEGDSRNVTYRKIASDTTAPDDIFLPVVKNLKTRYYTQPTAKKNGGDNRYKLFTVSFPYTDPKFFIDGIHTGRTYRLMDDIQDLILNVQSHGPRKQHSGDQNTTTVGIDGPGYAPCAEGRQLQDAIDQAVGYFRANADWFWSFYRQEGAVSEQTTAAPTCCDAPWLSAVSSPLDEWGDNLRSVLDSGVGGSSADIIYLGTNFVPPNGDGGYDDDGDDDDDDDETDSGLRVNFNAAIKRMNSDYDEAVSRLD